MNADTKEAACQQEVIDPVCDGGWRLGDPASYTHERALYTPDCFGYVKTTQPKCWQKSPSSSPAANVNST